MKQTLLTLFILCLISTAFAQKGTITGVLSDQETHKARLSYATVSVYKVGDSVLTTYGLSDAKGTFKIGGLKAETQYRLIVTAWQYDDYRKEFIVKAAQPILTMDTLFLSAKSNNLEEVNIKAEVPPIVVKKDTIEFNAASFKTLPTAVVEDLLKKLPGVTYDRDGALKVNGKDVSKILVDSKEFFGGDMQIATKNLPANLIDKVQVTDDKEAIRRDPDLIPANTPQIINLKLKKAIKKGMFGKVYAGGGFKELFETGGILNLFRDTTQISIMAYGNNVNKPGFSINDVQRIGGFGRSGINSMMVNTDGGFALNNISFGGASSGVQSSAGAGANFNTLTKGGIKINGQYFFGKVDNALIRMVNNNQTLGEDRLITSSDLNSGRIDLTHNLGAKIEWKPDTLNTITFEPKVTMGSSNSRSLTLKSSTNGDNQLVNTANTVSDQNAGSNSVDMLFSYWRDFKKAGRSFNTSVSFRNGQNEDKNMNTANSVFYLPPSNNLVDQLREKNVKNINTYLSTNYSEPINKLLSFNVALNANYINNEDALSTFYKDPAGSGYIIAVPSLSQTVMQSGFKSSARARLRWKVTKDLSIEPAIVFNTINLENKFSTYPEFSQHYNFVAPALNLRYKIFSFDYTPNFREPDVSYIQPIANNTDPLYVQNGNSNLLPATTHNFYANIYKYDSKNLLNYNFYLSGTVQKNAIIMSRVVTENGVQISNPVNANGIFSINNGGNFNKDFKKGKHSFKAGIGYWGGFNRNYVIVNNIKSRANILNIGPNLNLSMNLNDVLELNQTFGIQINSSHYDDPFFRNIDFTAPNTDTEIVLRFPKKVVWESTYRYSRNAQQIAGFNSSVQIWNAGVTFLFLKNDKAQLKFSVNDILQNGVRRYVQITQNAIVDTQNNNIGRYGLATLTYNIQNFGAKVGGRQRFFGF
jgi:hypothetical protein